MHTHKQKFRKNVHNYFNYQHECFNGKHEKLIEKANVLIQDNKIKTISTKKIEASDATVIDGGDRTLTPRLIDCHVHLQWNLSPAAKDTIMGEIRYLKLDPEKRQDCDHLTINQEIR